MKIRKWQSNMGADVRQGRLHFEVWEHGGATHCVPDNSLCGYRGTHYHRVTPGPLEEMAAAVVESWKEHRELWHECE